MKKISLTLVGLAFLNLAFASPMGIDRAWMRVSDPLIQGASNHQFSSLPLSGKVSDAQKYWSSSYWARYKGGINYRWNSSNPRGFNLVSPTKLQASQMSLSQLKALAPSEKWDLFIGRYDYPIKKEVDRYASPSRPTWEGICDGWAGAALNHDEPSPITLANPDGILIPFGTSDIKGLLSWYYAKKHSGGYGMMGRRCYGTSSSVDRCKHDMNAGAFHLVLTNRLGLDGKSFIADIDRNKEVWNHMAYKYTSTVKATNLSPLSSSAPGTVRMARIKTVVSFVWLLRSNTWYPVLGTSRQVLRTRTYEYYLDLNSSGKIIGGEWITTTRPDFLWLERPVKTFRGLFARLPELLKEIPMDENGEDGGIVGPEVAEEEIGEEEIAEGDEYVYQY